MGEQNGFGSFFGKRNVYAERINGQDSLVKNADSYVQKARELTEIAPEGIFLSPIFYHETLPFFEKWKAAKIPFVLFNTEIEDFGPLSYIGQDSYQSGKLIGKLMHYGQSEPCSVLVVHIDEKTSNAAHLAKKEDGFRDYFAQNDPQQQFTIMRVELDRSDQADFDDKLNQVLANTTDLRHIFVTNSKAHHIAAYLEGRGISNIKIIGYDLLPENIEFLNKGSIGFLINQNPGRQGYLGISQLADFLVFKKDVPKLKFLPLDIVTQENIRYYLNEAEEAMVKTMSV
jgi:LacI family transcriptional regulator